MIAKNQNVTHAFSSKVKAGCGFNGFISNSSFGAYGMKAFKKGKCNAPRV